MPGLKSTEQVGVREDLSDLIVLADMRQCSAVTMIPKETEPTNMRMEWQFDDYLDPSIKGHLSDVDRTSFENHSGRVRLGGFCQIFERAPMVGRIAQQINNVAGVGRKKEFAKCVAKALIVAKRDIETRILCQSEGGLEVDETPGTTRGLFTWADVSQQSEASTALTGALAKAAPVAEAQYSGAWANLTEEVFRSTILGAIWEVTGTLENFQLFAGRLLKALITSWTIYTPTVDGQTVVRKFEHETSADEDQQILRASVDVIEGDFGKIEITATPWLRRDLDLTDSTNLQTARRSGIIFDPEKTALRFNQMPQFRPFEDKGGGPRGLIEAIGGLVAYNPKCLAGIKPT